MARGRKPRDVEGSPRRRLVRRPLRTVAARRKPALGSCSAGDPYAARRLERVRKTWLVSPPVAPAVDVFARILAEVGRADDEDLEAFWPGLVASPRAGRDAHHVPFLELDDLVVDFHPPAPAHDHVHLFLLHVCVAVRKAIAGWDALVAQGGLLELERLGRRAELQVRSAVEPRADVLQIVLDV